MYDFAGKTVLITGASMGIGEVFARELARRGANLVLVARGEARLRTLADELVRTQGVRVDVWVEDLSRAGAAGRVVEAVHAQGLALDVLVNNAGFGAHAPFEAQGMEVYREMVDVNVGALVELTRGFMPDLERAQGGVINVASTAAFQPVPYMAVYGASKAFVLSFSEALWAEYRARGVRVLALCPGATESAFFARAGDGAAVGKKAPAIDVVRQGLAAFSTNRASSIHGAGNFVTALLPRWAPRALTARIVERMMRPRAALEPGKRAVVIPR